MEKLLQWTNLLEFPVGLLQDSLILVVQPIAFTVADGIHSLCVKLLVVDSNIGTDGCGHLDADKTAATTGIGQQILLITRSDKRSIPAHFTDGIAVRFPQIGGRLLQQMLQESLLTDVHLVELININQEETSQIAFCFLFALEIQTISISKTQFRR